MIAWKFLRAGAISPVTRFVWPAPGEWVSADAPIRACRAGFHACRPDQLAFWVAAELWMLELDGPIEPAVDAIVAPRARLVRKIERWESDGGESFLAHVSARAQEAIATASSDEADRMRPFVDTTLRAAAKGNKAIASYASASVLGMKLGSREEQARAFREERVRQSELIARELLEPVV